MCGHLRMRRLPLPSLLPLPLLKSLLPLKLLQGHQLVQAQTPASHSGGRPRTVVIALLHLAYRRWKCR